MRFYYTSRIQCSRQGSGTFFAFSRARISVLGSNGFSEFFIILGHASKFFQYLIGFQRAVVAANNRRVIDDFLFVSNYTEKGLIGYRNQHDVQHGTLRNALAQSNTTDQQCTRLPASSASCPCCGLAMALFFKRVCLIASGVPTGSGDRCSNTSLDYRLEEVNS